MTFGRAISWSIAPGYSVPDLSDMLDLDPAEALHGPDGDPDEVVIDDIMGKSFAQVLNELMTELAIPKGEEPTQAFGNPVRDWVDDQVSTNAPIIIGDDRSRIIPLSDRDGYTFGYAALTGDEPGRYSITGILNGCDLAVAKPSRGLGIGKAIIAARLLDTGDIPTWHHDKPSYSHAGAGCVHSGVALASRLAGQALRIAPEGPA